MIDAPQIVHEDGIALDEFNAADRSVDWRRHGDVIITARRGKHISTIDITGMDQHDVAKAMAVAIAQIERREQGKHPDGNRDQRRAMNRTIN